MSAVEPKIEVPYPTSGKLWARNERIVPVSAGRYVMEQSNHVLAHQRKMIASYSVDYNDLPAAQANPASIWRNYFHTGEAASGAIYIRFRTLLAPAGNASATDPYAYWELKNETTPSTTNSSEAHYGAYKSGWGLDDLYEWRVDVAAAADSDFSYRLVLNDYCQAVSASVSEYHLPYFDNSGTGICPTSEVTVGEPILDAHHTAMRATTHLLWKHNASHLISWGCNDDPALVAAPAIPSRTSGTAANVFDQTQTAFASADPGFKLQLQHHRAAHETANVPCVFAAYAKDLSGLGNGDVLLIDSNGTLCSLTGFNNTGEWKTTTFNGVGNTDTHEVQVYFNGDGVNAMQLWAFAAYEYVT